ncbi:hypothetical protein LEP1GSC191_0611 [Leptospira borgpetersenii serovar Mini str. 201000851]|uniref:Uncharacterized protein n=3 Tax=Leptospira borgpetersenii TaxID=174 RepID=M3HTK9_LEPBO|nr:hypothetical protein LEP1GSC128_2101 [Leptospira borgpetersenii str. 200801926]EMG01391.1 hypothetical protein LEP1GSC123_3774 [Leptospira borgpetersenii str. 200701203]EMK11443.1 hypothetical protein LEP1GSC066_1803 [Leptospira sp. serovar Kenya str. Sh9]EMN12556.1 hypothetical protein LEP1GSC055_1434 [Leptospira borgpetersenii str. Brem 307]EMN18187.1 hypothetical protein LEP1GSC056_1591 [Leptospira borgpetersenii str. Brem 328]ENO64628.1 hypothetical protein LEP1GSC191_0611 [Leptospira b
MLEFKKLLHFSFLFAQTFLYRIHVNLKRKSRTNNFHNRQKIELLCISESVECQRSETF